jgi:hypothetical protein
VFVAGGKGGTQCDTGTNISNASTLKPGCHFKFRIRHTAAMNMFKYGYYCLSQVRMREVLCSSMDLLGIVILYDDGEVRFILEDETCSNG